MALDESHGRLLIVNRNPPELLVLDTSSGKTLARVATCGDAAAVSLDDRHELLH
jgi:hypothetical protein